MNSDIRTIRMSRDCSDDCEYYSVIIRLNVPILFTTRMSLLIDNLIMLSRIFGLLMVAPRTLK